MYEITLGKIGPTDCCLKINDKEYSIKSKAWDLISIIYNSKFEFIKHNPDIQKLLKYIYENFDTDLLINLNRSTSKYDYDYHNGSGGANGW